MSASGGEPLRITLHGGFWPAWSPDGRQLVFCVFGASEPNVWVMDVDW